LHDGIASIALTLPHNSPLKSSAEYFPKEHKIYKDSANRCVKQPGRPKEPGRFWAKSGEQAQSQEREAIQQLLLVTPERSFAKLCRSASKVHQTGATQRGRENHEQPACKSTSASRMYNSDCDEKSDYERNDKRCHAFTQIGQEAKLFIGPLQFLSPLHGAHAADTANSKHHPIQVTKVFSLNNELHHRFPVFILPNVDAANIGIVVGDNSSQFFQHPGAVVAEDRNLYRIALRATRRVFANPRPLDSDAAIALIEEILHVGTTARMNRDPLAPRNVADNLLSANGVATSCAIHKQIVLTLDL